MRFRLFNEKARKYFVVAQFQEKKCMRSKDILSKLFSKKILMVDVLVKLQRSSTGMLLCIVADLTSIHHQNADRTSLCAW